VACMTEVRGKGVAEEYPYLIKAINALYVYVQSDKLPSAGELNGILHTACDALKTLREDKKFQDDLQKIVSGEAAKGKKDADMPADLDRNLWLFSTAFIRAEWEVLTAEGMSEPAISKVLWSANFFRDSLAVRRI
jgi:hypothetical protein